jgi:hypothetical protein
MINFNFIKTHLLNKISTISIRKYYQFNVKGFIFFDEPIIDGKYTIDRVNKFSPYPKDEIIPISWYMLKSETLLKIYEKLKDDKIYIKNVN